jgi:hypothetical protein
VSSIEEAIDDLMRKSIIHEKVEIRIGRTGIRYFFIRDPDNFLLEILEDKRGF